MFKAATWTCMDDVCRSIPHSSPVGADRVVFNVCGNKFRLVCSLHFCERLEAGGLSRGQIFVKWFGSHAEYDRIDVKAVEYEPR